jgi:transposase-like protein
MSNAVPRLLTPEEISAKQKELHTIDDVNAFIKDLVGPTIQNILEGEMTHHLGYAKHDNAGDNSGNSRNGYSQKTIKTKHGEVPLEVPRDREGSFEPMVVPKGERRVTSDIEDKIIELYASGSTTHDIEDLMNDLYGIAVSASMVSMITDKVEPLIREWKERPLSSIYPIVYLDGIHFKVRTDGKVMNKCGYTILGVNCYGFKELLGIWIGEHESAKWWMGTLNELKNRGVEDIFIACVDGLKGFSEAIAAIYPNTQIQRCIVHQVRASMKFIPHKLKDKFCTDLKDIYNAPNEEAGYQALQDMKPRWEKYAYALEGWEKNWDELSTFFVFSEPVRKLIYTTNGVESLHRQLRKVTKTTSVFPHDEALMKLLWLAQRRISKGWIANKMPQWSETISQLSVMFPNRLKLD